MFPYATPIQQRVHACKRNRREKNALHGTTLKIVSYCRVLNFPITGKNTVTITEITPTISPEPTVQAPKAGEA